MTGSTCCWSWRARRVDLAQLSIVDLAEQFGAALEAAAARRRVPLSRLGDWLVMAAHLALLRSRLLLPADSREGREAQQEAEALLRRLADWLEGRPRLGREVFARGVAEEPESADRTAPAADTAALLRACLAVLERPGRGGSYQPAPLPSGGCRTPWRGCAACCPSCQSAPRWSASCRRRRAVTIPTRLCGAAPRWPARCSPGWNWVARAQLRCRRDKLSVRSWSPRPGRSSTASQPAQHALGGGLMLAGGAPACPLSREPRRMSPRSPERPITTAGRLER